MALSDKKGSIMLQETKKQLLIAMINDIIDQRNDHDYFIKAMNEDKSTITPAILKLQGLEADCKEDIIKRMKTGYKEKSHAEDDIADIIAETIDNTIEAVVDIYLMLKD